MQCFCAVLKGRSHFHTCDVSIEQYDRFRGIGVRPMLGVGTDTDVALFQGSEKGTFVKVFPLA